MTRSCGCGADLTYYEAVVDGQSMCIDCADKLLALQGRKRPSTLTPEMLAAMQGAAA